MSSTDDLYYSGNPGSLNIPGESQFPLFPGLGGQADSNAQTDSGIRQSSNDYAYQSPFGKGSVFYTPEYVTENIDFVKLIAFIRNGVDAEFDYSKFIGIREVQVPHTYETADGGINWGSTRAEKFETEIPAKASDERSLNLKGKLNKEVCVVDLATDSERSASRLGFTFNYRQRKAIYMLNVDYVNEHKVLKDTNVDEIGITISSTVYDDFTELLKLCNLHYVEYEGNFPDQIAAIFKQAIDEVSKIEYRIVNKRPSLFGLNMDTVVYNDKKQGYLEWLYENIPRFAAQELDFEQTIRNISELNRYDEAGEKDTTAAITAIISKSNLEKIYNYYKKYPYELIKLVDQFDDDNLVRNMCDYLLAAVLTYGTQGLKPDNIRTFTISENAHIETQILKDNTDGTMELKNELQLPYSSALTAADFARIVFVPDIEINNPQGQSNQFHPLDIIYISSYDPDTQVWASMPSIALYGKYLGDKAEWSDIRDVTFAAVDIISILTSGYLIKAGVVGAARIIAYIDIAISAIDLGILAPEIKTKLNDTPSGKWLVEHWPIIALCTSVGTISYYLAKGILKHGPAARRALANKDDLAQKIKVLEKESQKVVDEIAEGAGASNYTRASKIYDKFGRLPNISKFEKEIRSLDYEVAKIFDDKGNDLAGLITQRNTKGVEFSNTMLRDLRISAGNNLIITHNHPLSSSISFEDVTMFIENNLTELRAVTREQANFCLKRVGILPKIDKFNNTILPNAMKRFQRKNAETIRIMDNIKNKNSASFVNANNKLKELYTNELLVELKDVVKYIKYE